MVIPVSGVISYQPPPAWSHLSRMVLLVDFRGSIVAMDILSLRFWQVQGLSCAWGRLSSSPTEGTTSASGNKELASCEHGERGKQAPWSQMLPEE